MERVSLYLERPKDASSHLASKLHGFLMNHLETEFVTFLHSQETNPLSTKLLVEKDHLIWCVQLLTDDSVQKVAPFLKNLESIKLDSLNEVLRVKEIRSQRLSSQDIQKIFQKVESPERITLYFETPTSFKSQGEFQIFPNERLMIQSLMQKYTRLMTTDEQIDEELLELLVSKVRISNYRLQSSYFKIHGNWIPAFRGSVTLSCKGVSTLKAYLEMLCEFGTWSGIGVKTSLGMGGLRIETRKD